MTGERASFSPFRFSISDLMLLTLSPALVLGLTRAMLSVEQGRPAQSPGFLILLTALYTGPVFAAVWSACNGWRSEAEFPRAAGHWLLVLSGIAYFERLAWVAILSQASRSQLQTWCLLLPLAWAPGSLVAYAAVMSLRESTWLALMLPIAMFRLIAVEGALIYAIGSMWDAWDAPHPPVPIAVVCLGMVLVFLAVQACISLWMENRTWEPSPPPSPLATGWHWLGVVWLGLETPLFCCLLPAVG